MWVIKQGRECRGGVQEHMGGIKEGYRSAGGAAERLFTGGQGEGLVGEPLTAYP